VNFHGNVVEIRKAPINVQNVITYDAVIAVPNPDLKLFPGMTANVKVLVDQRTNVLRVPNAALRFRPATASNASEQRPAAGGFKKQGAPRAQTVWVLGENGKPVSVPVKLGITDGVMSEVTSGDLKEGEQIIVGTMSETASAASGQPFGGGRGGPRF